MQRVKACTLAALLVFAAACDRQPTEPSTPAPAERTPAPLFSAASGRAIPGSYIVVLQDGSQPGAVAAGVGATPRFVWTKVLNGFAADLNQGQINALQHHPAVKYIEQDQEGTLHTTQYSATWGLDRIDQRSRPTNGTYMYEADGAGVRVYVIDSGILTSHSDFGGRASVGADFVGDGRNGIDCLGHGTHVAGTVGGATWGVAKAVSLVAVRIADCAGNLTSAKMISGMNWVATNRITPAVANASFGTGATQAVDDAMTAMINAGVTAVVSAGNNNGNACNLSPARVPAALTVGATSSNDARAVWSSLQASNYGTCLDLFAPGTNIVSAGIASSTATATMSGTSMASPHVAGVAAQYLQYHPTASNATVASAIIGYASTGMVSNAGTGSPNRLLYSQIPLPSPNVTVTYPGGVPTLSWGALINAQSYTVNYVVLHVYDDAADNIHQEWEDTQWLGNTSATTLTDTGRTYTGNSFCMLSQGMYTQEYEEHFYDVIVNYAGSTYTTRVQAAVAQCPY
ncbi:MAG: S8 family serine peptidase [Longimicrobiaceae bacterium]